MTALRNIGILAFTVAASLATAGANPSPAPSTFALLPLVAGDLGLPYAVLPTPQERGALGRKLARQVVQARGGVEVPTPRVAAVLAKIGIDQNSAYRQCASAECARRVGRALHVDTVMYGSVMRYMAMIWGTEVNLVDVATGKIEGPYTLGYKGDYMALSSGVDTLAQALSTRMIADAAARDRSRATTLTRR
ncbi:MAG: DUF3280 domain-containing protein [Candidatus Eremiobacteraeota bacterium]|nr:DUF3280 domain-containing protein [Candidatus Eremiobacteraeota bacterium]